MTAFVFHRGKELGEEGFEKLRDLDMVQRAQQEARQWRQRASSFTSSFMKDLQQGLKDRGDKWKRTDSSAEDIDDKMKDK